MVPQNARAAGELADRLSAELKSVVSEVRWKGPGKILTRNMEFKVTRATQILDLEGRKISLKRLPVPCAARIRFRKTTEGSPTALEIQVREILTSVGLSKGGRLLHRSSTRWSQQLPE